MALGGNQKESLSKNLFAVSCSNVESDTIVDDDNIRENEHLSFSFMQKEDEYATLSEKNTDDVLGSKVSDPKFNDFVDYNVSERNADDTNQSSDSLSSSASISDSDLTSTDSDDSLALSESESITDVTPLNSPYCDSPLPQSRHIEFKSDEKNLANPCRNVEYDGSGDNRHRPEMNVLMKAIEKLEMEAKNNAEFGFRESLMRRRASSFSNEESKRIEQENQRLFKRVISQQSRIRSIYSTPNQPSSKNISYRHQDLVKSDGDISYFALALSMISWWHKFAPWRNYKLNGLLLKHVIKFVKGTPKKSVAGKVAKEGDKPQTHRKQKCLSHPSSFIYSCNHLMDKSLLTDDLGSESSEKKMYAAPGMKIASSQKVESSCEEVIASTVEMQ